MIMFTLAHNIYYPRFHEHIMSRSISYCVKLLITDNMDAQSNDFFILQANIIFFEI